MAMRIVVGLAVILALVAGCRSKPAHPTATWQRTSDAAKPLSEARDACKTEALEKGDEVAKPGMASRAAGGLFVECMKRNGWVMVPAEKAR